MCIVTSLVFYSSGIILFRLPLGLPVSIILDYLQSYCVISRHWKTFSEAGMLLTKQWKRMSPKVMKKLVYIRYKKKYRKWMERLGISISEEELKGNWRGRSWWVRRWSTGRRPSWLITEWLWLFVSFFHFYADSCNYMLWQHACTSYTHVCAFNKDIFFWFLPRDALQCKARSCYCLSSVRPSVTLVDHDRQTDGQTICDRKTALCTIVHRTVKTAVTRR